jgi:AraC family transcriptional regulator
MFYLLLSGDHRDQTRRHEYDQPALTTVFHPTTGPHATAVGPEGMLGLNLEFTDDWLARHNLAAGDLADYRLLDSASARLLNLRLLAAAFASGDVAHAELDTIATELLAAAVTTGMRLRYPNAPGWLRRAEAFLRASFQLPISLRDAAREANVHPVHLARVFRRVHGLSVGQYLRILRLAEAGRLVVQRGCLLAEAAARAGFADQSHFTRCCSQALGHSPRALRLFRRHFPLGPGCCNRSRLGRRPPL